MIAKRIQKLCEAKKGTTRLIARTPQRWRDVDRTPRADREFRRVKGSLDLKAVDRRALERMDLLTVVEHELGHIAGLPDLASDRVGLMQGTLDTGTRRLVSRTDVDLFRACYQARWRERQDRHSESLGVR